MGMTFVIIRIKTISKNLPRRGLIASIKNFITLAGDIIEIEVNSAI